MKYRYKWIDPLGNIYVTEIEAEDAKTASSVSERQRSRVQADHVRA